MLANTDIICFVERFWIVELVRNARREEHLLGAAEITRKRCRHESLIVKSILMNMDHERGISVNLSDRMQGSLQVEMAAISTSGLGEHIGEPRRVHWRASKERRGDGSGGEGRGRGGGTCENSEWSIYSWKESQNEFGAKVTVTNSVTANAVYCHRRRV